MILVGSRLKIADNSGGRIGQCIKVFKGISGTSGGPGDLILVSIKSIRPGKKVKKGEMYKAVIIRLKKKIRRSEGSFIKYDENCIVLLSGKNNPVGTRVFGPILTELRRKGYMKVVSLAGVAI